MSITNLAVKRPLVVIMGFLAITLIGILAYTKLPVDLYPKVNLPYVYITTEYPGASPQDVETFVTKPVEDAVAGVSGLKNTTSTSAESISYVVLEFDISTDANTAASDTQRAMATISGTLPDGAKAPGHRQVRLFRTDHGPHAEGQPAAGPALLTGRPDNQAGAADYSGRLADPTHRRRAT